MNEAALWIAQSDKPQTSLEEAIRHIGNVINLLIMLKINAQYESMPTASEAIALLLLLSKKSQWQ